MDTVFSTPSIPAFILIPSNYKYNLYDILVYIQSHAMIFLLLNNIHFHH